MPNTVNLGLDTPNTGDKAGSWGTTSVNANWQVVDGINAGAQTISLASSSVTTLSISTGVIGTGSLTPGAGPTQSANRIITFSGILSSNCVVTMPRPGSWIVKNGCTIGSFSVQMRAVGTGNIIGLPPGEFVEVLCDGINMDFVNLGRVGDPIELPVSSVPAWMSACTVLPYLPCVTASIYSSSLYPALSVMYGSTYGGNGVSTFAVPPLGNRLRVPLGTLITATAGGIDGATLGQMSSTAAGVIGTSNLPASIPYTDPGHVHSVPTTVSTASAAFGGDRNAGTVQISSGTSTVNIIINPGSPNTPLSVLQPSVIYGMAFVRAG